MCGIAGYFSKRDNVEYSNKKVQFMLSKIKHRGPDDYGIYDEKDYGSFGMRRLSIQDLTENAHQPMFSEDLLVSIVYNGELYNSSKKKNELIKEGFTFQSNSDTEVILKLYLKYNEDCLSHMEGMFAFAIIDKREDKFNPKLFIARDQIGIKPLYYSYQNKRLVFCSELLPLITSKNEKAVIDPNSIRQLLNFGSIKQPNTIFKDVCMLMPGHKIVYYNDEIKVKKYWDLKEGLSKFRSRQVRNLNPIITIEDSLRNSVKEQLCGDVKIGTFLSGGIDSSLIAAIASQESSNKINTYSIGFNTDLNIKSELSRAKLTAKFLETEHNEIIVDENYILDNIEKFISSLDQPSVDGLNTFIISDYTGKEVKVALSGTGGDELFAGYPWFKDMTDFKPTLISKFLVNYNFLSSIPLSGKIEKLKNTRDFLTYFSSLHQIFNVSEVAKIMKPQVSYLNFDPFYDFNSSDVLKDETSILNRTSGLVLNTYLLNQLLRDIDALSMAHSLEVRVPFLSLDLLYKALCIDDSLKLGIPDLAAPMGSYKRKGEKAILFMIGKKYLPPDFDLVPKNGFTLPFDDWLRGPLRNLVNVAFDYLVNEQTEFFDPKILVKIKKDYYNNKTQWYKVWTLMVTGIWLMNLNLSNKQSN